MTELSKFKKFIVADAESKMPMAFEGEQFCYCTSSDWQDEHWPVQVYSYRKAMNLIKKSNEFRRNNKMSEIHFILYPVI